MRVAALASCATLLVGCGGSSAPSTYVAPPPMPAPHSISVTVSGLSGTGLVLQVNGGDDLSVGANGVATFSTAIAAGSAYSVTVSAQPAKPAQTCSVNNGSGTVGAADITGISVTCAIAMSAAITTLYSFNAADGIGSPNGSLVQGPDGSLYGTTTGAIFRITTSGEETTLYSFSSGVGGTAAGLILANDGNFYGTTKGDGLGGDISGSVYRISPGGAESQVYIWSRPDSGDLPLYGGVIQASDGLLYGTAYGSSVFSLTTAGGGEKEVPVLEYGSDVVTSSLVQARDGNLYGATTYGSVFKVVPASGSSTVTIIGSIGTGSAYFGSAFSLIEGGDGNLYGTTSYGGSPSATCPNGCGTVFKVTPTGVTTLLHSFGANPVDGQNPSGALVLASDGNFYGTTAAGGSPNSDCKSASGCGTLYEITSDGTEAVLYSFGTGASDGTGPSGALLQTSDGSLYGTTASGGSTGSGTVFKVKVGAN